MFKKAAALLLTAVIAVGASTAAMAENTEQVTVTVQQYGASSAKTWDGTSELEAGKSYVLKKNVTVKSKVTIPKGTKLTVKKGAKLTIGSKGTLTVKGTLGISSGATLSVKGKLAISSGAKLNVSGKLSTAKGSTVSDSGTIKLTKNKATVTVGGKLTINKKGKITGTPKTITLKDTAKVTVKGTNSCKKLKALLEGSTDEDKAAIEELMTGVVRKALGGDIYGAMADLTPEKSLEEAEKACQEQLGVGLEDFVNSLFETMGVDLSQYAAAADKVSVKVTKLTDSLGSLTDEQKTALEGCGDITKAYTVEMEAVIDESVADLFKDMISDEPVEAVFACAGGKWYCVG